MRCSIEASHLARYRCKECGIALCRMCDVVIHDAPARAAHRHRLIGHVAWDVSASPTMLERLERALCDPIDPQDVTEPADEYDAQTVPGPVLHEGDSMLAKLQGRLPPVTVDEATRARILARFETAKRQAAEGAPPARESNIAEPQVR